ncbi:MAG: hypothetical protein JXL80_06955 [Planctomycetes bacterium]|nr:hypothetical protein [Planctomycetota bacterium]
MAGNTMVSLDPAALSAFAASLVNLPREEIAKAKRLYILNAMADFEAARTSGKTMVIVLGIMSIIPVFLVVFIPSLIAYRSTIGAQRQKILNAIEVWRDDLGPDAADLAARASS